MNCLLCGVKLRKSNKGNYCVKCKLKYFPLKIYNSDYFCKQCGKPANYILGSQEYCCSKSKHNCSEVRKRNKETQKKIDFRYKEFDNIDGLICEYGCGLLGKYKSRNEQICCEDSFNKCPSKRKRNSETALIYTKEPEWRQALSDRLKGKKFTQEHKNNLSKSRKNNKKVKEASLRSKPARIKSLKKYHKNKWGWREETWTVYDTYTHKLFPVDKTRRDPTEPRILQVKCKYCGKWFRPTDLQTRNRCACLVNDPEISNSESHFYCSTNCKNLCPIFKKILYSDNDPRSTRTEVDPNLRKLVFERDNWECKKCGSKVSLECHHIDPVSQEPIFSNDMDSCITLCKKCHKIIHTTIDGCKYHELRRC